jgi:hypothetical protein
MLRKKNNFRLEDKHGDAAKLSLPRIDRIDRRHLIHTAQDVAFCSLGLGGHFLRNPTEPLNELFVRNGPIYFSIAKFNL